jgi:hypothetical protein
LAAGDFNNDGKVDIILLAIMVAQHLSVTDLEDFQLKLISTLFMLVIQAVWQLATSTATANWILQPRCDIPNA